MNYGSQRNIFPPGRWGGGEKSRAFFPSSWKAPPPVGAHSIDAACFGIAGPVVDGKVKTPNLPWMIDSGELRRALKLDSLALLNDLEAAAYGIFTLEDDEFCTLNHAIQRHSGNKALIAAGNGVGEA